ncbi:hypothetical protein CLAFUW4_08373 [Fulvia fulva]|uniref:Uncharacterized protein n=1 Tax=Passalora fulva TaxID=5499 RepID=A0A9Q8LD53_PASFU|nr:uncharacterized protein CLAFUR5_08478 [Fulvia fulva]KAK4629259.1 hypothetical protein CLAFUR4_08378 [Fulvia fulva]KAK4630030.1 hypothetical protein CLAFUR0_08373 [Fulvia fulva]UJO15222.1 hypothetical protein CLAFUR5_08478 [Fulvia fulva]WPV12656.1 hypothetical protein CLAFUW4_08373 [Fulvia fulva]WPV27936.1 hypothetical protein CLAFUW7_08373 [Fulvia fulva]
MPRTLLPRTTNAETHTSTYITIGIVTGLPVLILLGLALWICLRGKTTRTRRATTSSRTQATAIHLDIERLEHLRAAKAESQLPLHPALRPSAAEVEREECATEEGRSSEDTKAATASEGKSLATQSSDEILAMKYGFSWIRA